MTAADVLVKIRTFFDRKGATEATDALKQTAATAKQTGQQVDQAGKSGADGLNVMSAATAAMNGNFAGAATALVPLITKIKALGVTLTQLSVAGAVLTGLIKLLGYIRESARAAEEALLKVRTTNIEKELTNIAEAYDKWTAASKRSGEVRDAEYEKTQKTIDSLKREALALNELAKQRELSSVTDETLRKNIDEKYSTRAAGISSQYDEQSSSAETQNLLNKQKAAEKEANQKLKTARELRDAVKNIQAMVDKDESKIKRDEDLKAKWKEESKGKSDLGPVDAWFAMKVRRWARNEEDPDTVKARRDANAAAVKAKMKEAIDLEQQASSSSTMADQYATDAGISMRNRGTSRVEAAAATEERNRAAADRARANQEALRPALQELDAESADLSRQDQQYIYDTIKATKEAGKLTTEVVLEFVKYLREVKDELSRQRYQQ